MRKRYGDYGENREEREITNFEMKNQKLDRAYIL